MRTVLQCNKSGTVVIHSQFWRRIPGVPLSVADFIEANMVHLKTPEDWGMLVYQWQGAPRQPSGVTDCKSWRYGQISGA
jgi:hypothetical protein